MNRIRARLGPLWPYVVLIALPAAIFVLPDLLGGHLLMSGDNVQQNYPLRVLTGSLLRHGQLPLWDPYIFSGSPLLAGFNAGAAYPLIGLFVILPDRAAWIATEVVLFAAIGVGMYVFLRALALSTVACLLAALTFSFSGTVLSQVNHVDMTEGFVAIPWMLLATLHIVRDGRWRWSVLLGVGFALVILGGAPEAMLDEAILVFAYAALSAGLDRDRWWRVLSRGGAGAVLALSLAAIQWLPGLSFIASSQRSGVGSSFASAGSYPPVDGLLSLVPYLFGGYGHLGEARFFSGYNLPEVGIYLGILPIVALLVLWIPAWPSRLAPRERRTWYLVGLLGVLLALGGNTPLEHLFNEIPLYGHQRLQSRNMIDFSVVVCVLFAGWIDRGRESPDPYVRVDRWTAAVPAAIVVVLAGLALFDPNGLITSVAGASPSSATVHTVREATVIALGFCLVAWVIVWLRPVLADRRWVPLMSLFVLVDIGLMAATSQLVTPPPNDLVAGTTPIENYVAAHLAPGGRFVVYDPQQYGLGLLGSNGLPDDNILADLPSVGGYSSIVNGNYGQVTQAHTVGQFNVAELASGTLDDLDLQDILTVPEYFMLPLASRPTDLAAVQPESQGPGRDPVLPKGTRASYENRASTYYPAPRAALSRGQVGTWFFGQSLVPTAASLVFSSGATAAAVRFGTFGARGTVTWGRPVATVPGTRSVTGTLPPGEADGLAVQVTSGRIPVHQAVVTVDQRAYALNGSLSAAVQPGGWRQQGSVEGETLFVRHTPPAPLRAVTARGQPAPGIEVVSSGANAETVRVRAAGPLALVRDVAEDAGWRATVSVDGAPARTVPLTAYGLVQQVHLPRGDDVVTFRYRPAHFDVAVALTAVAALLLVVLAAVALWTAARRRRGRTLPPA
ncbi:MAG: hypothetical protein ACLPVF_14855 [Acidimicrobiales bacterium]